MFMNMSKRVKFFLGHFCISLFIASIVVGMVFFIWYPSPLAKAVNVTHIFLMMLMIDVIIGPVLGLLVYKDGKKTLKFDLTVIILIQLSALCYGVYTIAQGRPVWIVYSVDRFELVKNNVDILNFIDDYTFNGSLFNKDLIISYDLNFGDNKNKIKIRIFNSELTINYYLFNKTNLYSVSKTKSSKDFYKCIESVFYEVYLKELYPEGKKSLKKLKLIKMDRY